MAKNHQLLDLYEYEIQIWKYGIPFFFYLPTLQHISVDLDLQIFVDCLLVERKSLYLEFWVFFSGLLLKLW